MKRILLAVALALPLGCHPASTPTPPAALAPGYLNPADQQMGEILAGAHSFYVTIQADSATGKVVLTPTEKTAFNDFGVSLNAAQTVYLAFHQGTATQATAQAAVDAVQQKQTALPALAVTK